MRVFWSLVFMGVFGLGFLGLTLIRTASHDPEVWHVDPLTAEAPESPNWYRVAPAALTEGRISEEAPIYVGTPDVLAQAFEEFVLRQPDTFRIGGTPSGAWMTYVQRSETIKFPDYISVRFLEVDEARSTVAIYSRSRYGYGDLGVNQARVTRWLATLQSFEE
ncbi:MAG: DUF1499 domain-containing protein [Pseudomonadota bacterium]